MNGCDTLQLKLVASQALTADDRQHVQRCRDCSDIDRLLDLELPLPMGAVPPPGIDAAVRTYARKQAATRKRNRTILILHQFRWVAAAAAVLALLLCVTVFREDPAARRRVAAAEPAANPWQEIFAPYTDDELALLAPAPPEVEADLDDWNGDELDLALMEAALEIEYQMVALRF